MQVAACLLSWRGRHVQGPCRSHPPGDPRRAVERDGQTLFELCTRLTMRHGLARPGRRSPSTSTCSRRRAGRHAPRGPVQVPLPRHVAARGITERWPIDRGDHEDHRHQRARRRPGQGAAFYTDVLGFVKKTEIPLGEHRWLTVVSPDDPDGIELLLEPDGHPAVGPFKAALVEDGIPFTSFARRRRAGRVRAAARAGRAVHAGPPLRWGR